LVDFMHRTRRTICIVDDDASVLRALGRLIRSVRMEVETFATAEEYLQCPEQSAPGCLILDMHLPGLSGVDLQKVLAARGSQVPVIFITAFEERAIRDQALRQGALAFLHKPFEERALLDAVNQALAGQPG
jgi:FixJ family two-component response regulator